MSTPENPPATTTAPRLPVRIAWWLGIYLALVAGPIIFHEGIRWLSTLPASVRVGSEVVEFPIWLAFLFQSSAEPLDSSLLLFVGFGIYLLHFVATLRISRRITFFIMLALLVMLIGLTFLGLGNAIASHD